LTISALDLSVVPSKDKLVEEAREKIERIEQEYNFGRLTVEERYEKIVNIWRDVVERVTDSLTDYFKETDGKQRSGAAVSWAKRFDGRPHG